jgi:hypothetical protein
MRDNTLTSLVILALNLDSVEAEHKAISSFLGQGYKRQPLDGCYKGEVERSYILEVGSKSLQDILAFSKEYNQESILYLDNQRLATLIYSMDNMTSLGLFKGVSEAHAKSKDAYTFNPITNTYYIAA